MSGHTFGERLYFLRHYVKRVSRMALANELARVGSREQVPAALRGHSADDIRVWERTGVPPSPDLVGLLCRVMGFARSLLDPEQRDWKVSPQLFLRYARMRGWGQLEIAHNWKTLEQGIAFHGDPQELELERILETYGHRFIDARQASLFWDEFSCTHCGHWQSDTATVCPQCGNEE